VENGLKPLFFGQFNKKGLGRSPCPPVKLPKALSGDFVKGDDTFENMITELAT